MNSYGLFTSKTTLHLEIILEGRDDGETCLPYEFKNKIGDPRRQPPILAPYQPRPDWQI